MNEKSDHQETVLEHVDSRRRNFLAKLLAGGAAATALPMMTTEVFGQDGAGPGQGKGGGNGKGKGGRPDPARLAALLIKNHDRDGDKALNHRELTAALTELFRRRQQGKGGPGQGKGGPGKGGPGQGKGGPGQGGIGGRGGQGKGAGGGRGKGGFGGKGKGGLGGQGNEE